MNTACQRQAQEPDHPTNRQAAPCFAHEQLDLGNFSNKVMADSLSPSPSPSPSPYFRAPEPAIIANDSDFDSSDALSERTLSNIRSDDDTESLASTDGEGYDLDLEGRVAPAPAAWWHNRESPATATEDEVSERSINESLSDPEIDPRHLLASDSESENDADFFMPNGPLFVRQHRHFENAPGGLGAWVPPPAYYQPVDLVSDEEHEPIQHRIDLGEISNSDEAPGRLFDESDSNLSPSPVRSHRSHNPSDVSDYLTDVDGFGEEYDTDEDEIQELQQLRRNAGETPSFDGEIPIMDLFLRGRQARPQHDELVGVEVRRSVPAVNARNNPSEPAVIDLTGDDGEDQISQSQNARRRQSQHRDNAPRLNRSDSNYINNQAVIELSSDSEDGHNADHGELRSRSASRRNAHHHHAQRAQRLRNGNGGIANNRTPTPNNLGGRQHPPLPQVPQPLQPVMAVQQQFMDFFNRLPVREFFGMANHGHAAPNAANDDDLMIMGVGEGHNYNANPMAFGHVHLNYEAHPFQRPGQAGPLKPQHEPPAKAQAGFTRDTGGEEILICPSCEEELTYDPDETTENGPPTKKAKTRRDPQCHFWAVKACGHVRTSRHIARPEHQLTQFCIGILQKMLRQ